MNITRIAELEHIEFLYNKEIENKVNITKLIKRLKGQLKRRDIIPAFDLPVYNTIDKLEVCIRCQKTD